MKSNSKILPSLASQIASGAMFTTLATGVKLVSGTVLQMILVRMITVDEFGLYKLAMELSSFGIMFVTFFVGGNGAASTTRIVAVRLSDASLGSVRSAIITSLLSVTVMSLFLVAVGFFFIPWMLRRFFQVPPDQIAAAIVFFRWFLIYIFVSGVSTVLGAALRGCEFFGAFSAIETVTNILRLALIPLLLHWGSGLNGIVWGFSGAILLAIVPSLWILETFNRAQDLPRINRKEYLKDLKALTGFGIPVFISTLSSTVYYSADALILGYYLPVKYVALYGAGIVLVHSLLHLFSGLETALFPILSSSLQQRAKGQEAVILEKAYRLLIVVSAPASIFSFVMTPYMIRFLFGLDYFEAVAPARILTVLVLAWALMPASVMFLSTGMPHVNARLGVISAVLNILLDLALIPFLGIIGAAISNAFSRLYGEVQGVRICGRLFGASFPWVYCAKVFAIALLSFLPIQVLLLWFDASVGFLLALVILAVTAPTYCMIFGLVFSRSSIPTDEDKRIMADLLEQTPLKILTRLFRLRDVSAHRH